MPRTIIDSFHLECGYEPKIHFWGKIIVSKSASKPLKTQSSHFHQSWLSLYIFAKLYYDGLWPQDAEYFSCASYSNVQKHWAVAAAASAVEAIPLYVHPPHIIVT